jgi:magnesium-transporting ATPase (P-type)
VKLAGKSKDDVSQHSEGLTSVAAAERLRRYGPNAVVEEHARPWRTFLAKLWAPFPCMLELTILLELLLGKTIEAGVITVLLFNAVLSFVQENRAQNALALLRQRLAILARVLRDGCWQKLPAVPAHDPDCRQPFAGEGWKQAFQRSDLLSIPSEQRYRR